MSSASPALQEKKNFEHELHWVGACVKYVPRQSIALHVEHELQKVWACVGRQRLLWE